MVKPSIPYRSILLVFGLSISMTLTAMAQISPGKLSEAHASLEGLTNCTTCHQFGKAVLGEKCLDCHVEIKSRVGAGRGYHARVQKQNCVDCHKEHHGRSFDLRHFDETAFNHASIGFTLEGKHAAAKCQACHTARYIRASDILGNKQLMKKQTFLGLAAACRECHEDVHRGQLKNDCQNCHGAQSWKPASLFNHATTLYPLTGKHASVRCERCHPRRGSGVETIKFAGLKYETCSDCHGDPHKNRFKQSCESCHSTNGWNVGASRHFNHASTRYPLRGKHATVSCESCHRPAKDRTSGRMVQRFTTMPFQKCTDCHQDPHRREFARFEGGGKCESCHTENGFVPSLFAHDKSRYPLVGKHEVVACKKCHTPFADSRGSGPLNFQVKKFSRCSDCHADSHAGQFASRRDGGACESCHTPQGYIPSTYAVRQHALASFTLTGSHQAVMCTACHKMKSYRGVRKRQFVWNGDVTCATCHENVHAKQFRVATYGGCESCHVTTEWKWFRFDHNKTKFSLADKHATTPCAACHTVRDRRGKILRVRYGGTPTRCLDCHQTADGRTLRGS